MSDPSHGAKQPSSPAGLRLVLLDYRDITHPEAGGAETYLDEIFQRLAAQGHAVTLLCGRYPGAAAEDQIGRIRVLRVGNKANLNVVAARAALKLARQERVDLFVENMCKIPFLLPVLTRVPVLPIAHHLLGDTVFYETNPAFGAYVWLYERLIPPVYRGVRFVAVSDSTAQDLRRRGLRSNRIDIVHNGLNLERYPSHLASPSPAEPLLVYLGRLTRYKGIDVVIRAFAQVRREVPEARLVLVGKGYDRGRLEKLAATLGLGAAVLFRGYVGEEEKIDWLRRARAVLYPSRKEGWGIAAMEAAACGTPAVASDTDGLRDAVRDGVTGFLVPHRDVDAWARRMVQALTDDDLRRRLSAAAREWASGFSWDVQAAKMRAVVEEIVAVRAAADPT